MKVRRTIEFILLSTWAVVSVARGPADPPVQQTPAAGGAAGIGGIYDVRVYGALGDARTLDTAAINRTIEAAAAAGGGTVRFPAGTYLCHSIHLKSNVALYLDQGATILAADPPPAGGTGGYDPAEANQWDKFQDFGHSHWHNSLLWGEGIENVSILGPGLINGRGLTREADPRAGVGNKAIALRLCRNVIIRDISILRAGHFGILATGVDNLTIDNLKIDTNRDGVNVDGCRNVRISNLSVNSPWDDGICLKSSYGLGVARATENVTITGCQLSGYDTGTFLDGTFQRSPKGAPDGGGPTGRIKFGTESNGGFKNIAISNCVFDYCRGLALETVDGGLLEDVSITNITMRDIVNSPLFLRLGSRMRGPEGTPVGALRRVIIGNIMVYNADPRYGSIISGIPGHDIEDVKLSNIRIFYRGGGTTAQAALEPPEKENDYPEPARLGEIPAYGFFIRHVKGIEFNNVEVSWLKEDLRPAFILNNVMGSRFLHVNAQHAPGVPTFVLKSIEDFSTHHCGSLPDTQLKRVGQKKL